MFGDGYGTREWQECRYSFEGGIMKNCLIGFVAVSSFAFAGCDALGQNAAQLIRATEIHVKPGQTVAYEAARRDLIAHLRATGSPFGFTESRSENQVYRRLTPLENYATLDAISARRAEHPVSPDILARLDDAVEHTSFSVVRTRPDLGYQPATPRLSQDEVGLLRYGFLYFRRDARAEVGPRLKALAAVLERNNSPNGMGVAQVVSGPDMPMYLLRFPALDADDYYQQQASQSPEMAADVQGAIADLRQLYRRFDISLNTVVPELSYQPN
jgi:hypothetical protein